MGIQTEPLKQKRRRRKRGGSGTARLNSTAQEQLGATRTEAVRRGRAARDDTMTARALNMTVIFLQKNASEQATPMAVVTIRCPPTTPQPQTVQLTVISTVTQVLQDSHIQSHLQMSLKYRNKCCCGV